MSEHPTSFAGLFAKPQPELLKCGISPRPLEYSLHDYHIAMSEGPLHYTWTDKPHRLVYDLIAAVQYYADPRPHKVLTVEEAALQLAEAIVRNRDDNAK